MPVSKYNRYFGGKPGSAQKAKDNMRKTYGDDHVFYAKVNKARSDHSAGGLQGARQARVDKARQARRRRRK